MTLVQTEPKKIYIRVDQQGWQPGTNTLAYWKFDGNLNNAYVGGATLSGTAPGYTTGVSGQALVNTRGFGIIESSLSERAVFGGAFAIACFISLNNTDTLQRLFGSTDSIDIQFEFYNSFSGFQVYNNANSKRIAFPFSQPPVGEWHSFILTGDGVNQIELYIDGTKVNPYSGYNQNFDYPQSTSRKFNFGYYQAYVYKYDNNIDELVIENKYWTQTDVDNYLALFN